MDGVDWIGVLRLMLGLANLNPESDEPVSSDCHKQLEDDDLMELAHQACLVINNRTKCTSEGWLENLVLQMCSFND